MKQNAVIALLWPSAQTLVFEYLNRNSDEIVILSAGSGGIAPHLKGELGKKVILIESLCKLGPPSQAEYSADIMIQLENWLADGSYCQADWAGDTSQLTRLISDQAKEVLPHLVTLAFGLEAAKELYNVTLLCVSEDLTALGKFSALWAKKNAIPSIHFAHSVNLLRDSYTVHGAQSADILAIYGERGIEAYLDMGVPKDRIKVVGNASWDKLPKMAASRSLIRQRLAEKHGLDSGKPIIVFATTWPAYLSAATDPYIYSRSLREFIRAIASLGDAGAGIQWIVKDRQASHRNPINTLEDIIRSEQISSNVHIVYDSGDSAEWVCAADIVVGINSNMLVEAMIVGTPAINLVLWETVRFGPCFSPDSGVVEVGPAELATALHELLVNSELQGLRRQQLLAAAPAHNVGVDGQATQRAVDLMESMKLRGGGQSGEQYVWRQYLDVENIDKSGYHAGARADLVEMFSNNPKIVLDIGCAAGGTGELLKRKYPSCQVWGVETNRSAAKVAAERLDRVLVGKFEEFDLEREGIAKGMLDGVILADVLEHMYNPWAVMVALQPYLSATAQVIISIPNVRNLKLMEDLAAGFWRYDAAGLLDITHIRFFTLKEFRRFLHETGFHVNFMRYGIDQRLAAFFQANKDNEKLNVELGRMTLANVSKEELSELCSLQFYINAGVGALNDDIRPYHASNPYAEYLQRCRLTEAEARQFDGLLEQWQGPPKVAVAVYLPSAADDRLTATIKNLSSQLYRDISIWVLSPLPLPQGVPVSERFRWLTLHGSLATGLPTIAAQEDAEWLAWLNAGDQLEPQALLRIVEAARRHAEWHFIYTDEDLMLAEGEFGQPVFKPDFDPNYLLSMPYIGGLGLIRRDSLLALDGIAEEIAGAEQIDLALRCWQRWGEGAVGHVPSVLYHRHSNADIPVAQQVAAAQLACVHALQRGAIPAELDAGWAPGSFRWRWQGPKAGMVSLLIAVRDDLPRLQRCIEGLFQHTHYPEFEILLLDNRSSDAAAMAFLQGLDAMGDPRLRVFRCPDALPLAQLHNLLAKEARGQVLGFMHFDCVPLDADWLDVLTGELLRPGVAAVAPRLLDGQGKVRGGGLILGIDGGYAPAFAGLMHNEAGPLGRAHVAQSFSALSGGMLLVRRDSFEQLGGFDPECAAAAEVDFCLRLRQNGSRALWTPYVSLMCEGVSAAIAWSGNGESGCVEKLTIDDATSAVEPLLRRWLADFANDPAYNRNLTSVGQPFLQEHRQVLQRPMLDWKPLPRILLQPADTTGCGYYRMLEPANTMLRQGMAETLIGFDLLLPNERSRLQPDSIVFQRQIYENQVTRMRQARKFLNPFMVYELDDLITNVPVKSLHRTDIPADTVRWLREAIGLCDRFIVSTESLAYAMRGYNDDIRVVPNRLDRQRWADLNVTRRQGKKPRVGWAGGVSHTGDLELIVDVVKELADEVDWVFLGLCPEFLRPYVLEFHPGVPFEQYPAKMASLGLDLALAPLELNAFNESKSNLKLLEYGVLGYPVICTDITPYRCDLPVLRVKNRFRDWVTAIRESVADRDALAIAGGQLRRVVLDQWMLDDHCAEWLAAWLP